MRYISAMRNTFGSMVKRTYSFFCNLLYNALWSTYLLNPYTVALAPVLVVKDSWLK